MKSDDIKSAAKDFASSVGKTAGDAQQALRDGASRYTAQAQDVTDGASGKASDLYGRANDTLNSAANGLPDSTADSIAAGQRVYDRGTAQLARQVSKQPIEALILAGAIGYLVGWATSRS